MSRSWLAILVLGVAGCLRVATAVPTVTEYRLDYAPPPLAAEALPVVLRLGPLGAAAIYDREAIVYREGDYATGTYSYHRWIAPPGRMLADLLARDLAASGLYRAVQRGVAASDYDLGGEIEEFAERVAAGACSAQLRLRFSLVRARPGPGAPVLLQKSYAAEEPCAGTTVDDFVAAMSRAVSGVSQAVQQDVRAAIAADRAGGS